MKEFIICAANHYNDGKKHEHQPKNIVQGFITCGRRHRNCLATFKQIASGLNLNDVEEQKLSDTEINGFLTSTDKFVNRQEAYVIAFNADQIVGPNKGISTNDIGLTSEDLY